MTEAIRTLYQDMPCIKLTAGKYTALIAHELGSNALRLRDTENGIEVFRFNEEMSIKDVADSIEIWGLPTMYLPNRLDRGTLRVSDYTYTLPMNEGAPFSNCLHGFLHRRKYEIISLTADNNLACAVTRYVYDENDKYFKYFPIKFTAEITFTLSDKGLEHKFTLTNNSNRMMPISVATHTTINAPFVDGGKQENIRFTAPIGKKCELNERCLPTEKLLELEAWDLEYKNGTKCPVLQVVNNDMYFAEEMQENGEAFHGVTAVDLESGKKICYETSREYGFWIFWNEWGQKGYFCPEPMSAMINAPNLNLPKDVTGYREISPEESFTAVQRFSTK